MGTGGLGCASQGDEHAHLTLRERGCHARVQARAIFKTCALELSMEGRRATKVWCVVAVGAVRSGRQPALWSLVDSGGVEAAVGGSVICIAQPSPLHTSECLGFRGNFGMLPPSWVNRPSTASRFRWSSSVWHKSLGICDPEEVTFESTGLLRQPSRAVGCRWGLALLLWSSDWSHCSQEVEQL